MVSAPITTVSLSILEAIVDALFFALRITCRYGLSPFMGSSILAGMTRGCSPIILNNSNLLGLLEAKTTFLSCNKLCIIDYTLYPGYQYSKKSQLKSLQS